jgi:hypothetical protein
MVLEFFSTTTTWSPLLFDDSESSSAPSPDDGLDCWMAAGLDGLELEGVEPVPDAAAAGAENAACGVVCLGAASKTAEVNGTSRSVGLNREAATALGVVVEPELPSGVAGCDGRAASGSEGGLAKRTAEPTAETEPRREPNFETAEGGESEPDKGANSAARDAGLEAVREPGSEPGGESGSEPITEPERAAESADKEAGLNPD